MAWRPPEGVLSKQEMRDWSRPNRLRLALDLSLIWGQAGLGIALFLNAPHWTTLVIAWFLIGGAQHALALTTHEGAHFLMLPHNRAWNDRISRWLFAGPIGLPFSVYRERHFIHHREVSTEDDTKELYRRRFKGWGMVWESLRSLSGFEWASSVFRVMMGLRSGAEQPKRGKRKANPRHDFMAIFLFHCALMGLFGDVRLYLLLWAFPMLTVLQFFGKLRAAVEHCPLDSESGEAPDSPYFRGTEKPHLRTVVATPVETLFLSRLNFHYHAEHHLYPQISYQYLPEIHRRLAQRNDHGVVFERSYTSVLLKLWRGD